MNLSDIAILKTKNANYRCIISRISKNINLIEKSETLQTSIKNKYQQQLLFLI